MGPLLAINGLIDGHLGLQPLEMEFFHPAYNWEGPTSYFTRGLNVVEYTSPMDLMGVENSDIPSSCLSSPEGIWRIIPVSK